MRVVFCGWRTKKLSAIAALAGAAAIGLSACQSAPTTIDSTTYQGAAPEDRGYNRAEAAKARTALAAQYIGERKLDAAKRQLEIALQADNRYAPAYDMMGVLYNSEGSPQNVAKAEGYFRRAIEIDGQFMPARNNYGVYLSQLERYREAITQLEIAGSTLGYEGRARALENLGIVYKKLGQIDTAKEIFARAIDANSDSAVARVELIDVFLQEGNVVLAKRLYDDLNRLAGNRQLPAEVLLQGVRIAVLQGNQSQQQQLAQRLLSWYPLSDEAVRLKQWLADPSKPLS